MRWKGHKRTISDIVIYSSKASISYMWVFKPHNRVCACMKIENWDERIALWQKLRITLGGGGRETHLDWLIHIGMASWLRHRSSALADARVFDWETCNTHDKHESRHSVAPVPSMISALLSMWHLKPLHFEALKELSREGEKGKKKQS